MCENPSWRLDLLPLPLTLRKPQHPANIYTCEMTSAPRVHGGKFSHSLMRDIYIRI